jgi:hypothetical protein
MLYYTIIENPGMTYNHESIIGFFLVVLLLSFSLHIQIPYYDTLRKAAYNPFLRLIAITFAVVLSSYNPILGILAALCVFFWIADVSLLSRK